MIKMVWTQIIFGILLAVIILSTVSFGYVQPTCTPKAPGSLIQGNTRWVSTGKAWVASILSGERQKNRHRFYHLLYKASFLAFLEALEQIQAYPIGPLLVMLLCWHGKNHSLRHRLVLLEALGIEAPPSIVAFLTPWWMDKLRDPYFSENTSAVKTYRAVFGSFQASGGKPAF